MSPLIKPATLHTPLNLSCVSASNMPLKYMQIKKVVIAEIRLHNNDSMF